MLAGDTSPEVWREAQWVAKRYGMHKQRQFAAPLWDGQPIPGKTLLVWAGVGLGLGDLIQWSRLLHAAKVQSQATVILEVLPGMRRLFTTLQGLGVAKAEILAK